jgi:hypothetical protein
MISHVWMVISIYYQVRMYKQQVHIGNFYKDVKWSLVG